MSRRVRLPPDRFVRDKMAFMNDRSRCLLFFAIVLLLAPVPAQPREIVWADPIEIATGEAYQGPWRMNSSEFHYVDDPTIALNEEGSIGVVWADQKRRDLFFQRYASNGETVFENPVRVSRSPDVFSWLPRLVMAGGNSGHVYVLWQEIVFSGGSHGGEIFFARSIDGGASFPPPLNLSNSLGGDGKGRLTERYWHNGSLDIAIADDGVLYATWTEYRGTLWFSRSIDGGNSFSKPFRITSGGLGTPASGPSIAVYEQTVHVVWTVGEDESADIHLSQSFDSGKTFAPPRVAVETVGHSDAPKVAADTAGTLHLVFGESPLGPFERYHVRYMRSNDGGQNFHSLRTIPNPLPHRFKSGSFPSLALVPDGRLYMLWELFPDARTRSTGLGFTLSTDSGETFAASTLIPGSADPALGHNGSRQGLLMRKLEVNTSGDPAIVNSTFRNGQSSHIWLWLGRIL